MKTASQEANLWARRPPVVVHPCSAAKALSASNSQVKVVKGELQDEERLSSSIQGQNVVVSILGPMGLKTPPGTYTNAYKLIFKHMRQHSVKRILAMGTFSVEDSKDKSSWIAYLLVSVLWIIGRSTWQEVVSIGKTFEEDAKDLDWTVYRLGFVVNGEDGPTQTTHVGSKTWKTSITRNQLAGWLVDQSEKAQAEYVHEKPLLCTK